jgi:hypothetical protein
LFACILRPVSQQNVYGVNYIFCFVVKSSVNLLKNYSRHITFCRDPARITGFVDSRHKCEVGFPCPTCRSLIRRRQLKWSMPSLPKKIVQHSLGPQQLSRAQLRDVVYKWYIKRARRIQIPSQVATSSVSYGK